MREYGGYIELESFYGDLFHEKAVALNCGRNALAYLCEAKKIRKLYLPYFLCSSVADVCNKIGVRYEYYHISQSFEPLFEQDLGRDEWLYIVNFYGQLSNDAIVVLKQKYDKIIVDNCQSFFQPPAEGVDTLYTCRKYFGVPDGAFLYTDKKLERELFLDESYQRMRFLLGRYECGANEFYADYVANNKLFANEPIKYMSKLTKNLMRGIDYKLVARKRQENFAFLDAALAGFNKLKLKIPYGAFMYPLWLDNGSQLRKSFCQNKIYIPTLWPNIVNNLPHDWLEWELANNILPLPIDQRYGIDDMRYMLEVIRSV